MDVVTADQAKIAEDAGAVAVMALERVPADIRAQGGVARMSDPDLIDGIVNSVSIPVMAKARIGHFVEAQILQSLGVDYLDESEVLTPADYAHHIEKWQFDVPFVCGATNLGEALRRITEGAAVIRSKGDAGTGDGSHATTHMRTRRTATAQKFGLPPITPTASISGSSTCHSCAALPIWGKPCAGSPRARHSSAPRVKPARGTFRTRPRTCARCAPRLHSWPPCRKTNSSSPPRNCRLPTISCVKLPRPANSRSRCSPPGASPRRPMRR